MFDRDLLMLQVSCLNAFCEHTIFYSIIQVVAALSEPNRYLVRVLDRFALTRWASISYDETASASSAGGADAATPATPAATPEDLSRITVTLAEECLHLLIMLLLERETTGVGEVEAGAQLQREIVHALCTGPKPFSYLERYHETLGTFRGVPGSSLHDVLNEIATLQRPASTSVGVFVLKSEYRSQYNAFFAHYSKMQVSQVSY